MTRFKTLKEFNDFKDNAMFCLCGRLMTGLHMQGCNKLKKEEVKVIKRTSQLE